MTSNMLFVLVFLSALLAAYGFWVLFQGQRSQRQLASLRRLRRLAEVLQAPNQPSEESILRSIRRPRSLFDHAVRTLPFAESLALQLYRAGLPMSVRAFVTASLGMAAGGCLLAWMFLADPVLSAAALLLGAAPWVYVRRLYGQRMRAFEEQFPDALDMLIRALRAGHSLSTGFQLVGRELPDPVGTEFGQVAHEIRLGQDLRNALSNLAYRVDSADLPFFVTAIGIQQETGSNLAEVLENLAHVIRERFRLYGKVRALTAMGRASANLLAVWPVVMVGALYAVNPDYVRPLWETGAGHVMAGTSVVLVLVGYLACRRLATIRV